MANIAVNIVGHDKSASSSMNKVASNASTFSSRMKGFAERTASVFAGLELREAADKVVDFAKESVDKLSEVAGETRKMQRVIGGTPEQVSALDAAAEHMGVSLTSLSTAAGIMSKGIVNGKSALTGLGIETKNADGSARGFTELLPEVAEKFAGMTNSTQRTALAMQIFGRGGKDLLPLLMKGKDGIAELEESAKKLGVTIDGKTLESTTKYKVANKELHEAIEGVQMKLGAELYPTLTKVTEFISGKVVPAVSHMFEWMQKNPVAVAAIAKTIGILVAAGAGLLGFLKAWTIAQTILDIALDANPIGLIVIAVGALIAVVALIVANWSMIGPWLANLWSGILAFLTGVWNNIVTVATTVWAGLVSYLTGLWDGVVSGVTGAWNGIVSFFSGIWANLSSFFATWGPTILAVLLPVIGIPMLIAQHWNEIVAFLATIPGKFASFVGGAANWLAQLPGMLLQGVEWGIAAGLAGLYLLFVRLPQQIGAWLVGAGTWLLNTGVTLIAGIATGIATGWNATAAWFTALPGRIAAFVVAAGTWLLNTGTSLIMGALAGINTGWIAVSSWFIALPTRIAVFVAAAGIWLLSTGIRLLQGMASGISNGWSAVASWLASIPGRVIGALAAAGSWLVGTGSSVLHGMANGLSSGWGAVSSFLAGIPGDVMSALGNAGSWLLSAGRHVIDGFVNGLEGAASAAYNAVSNVASGIMSKFQSILGIHSPSRVFHGFGQNIVEGLVNGISSRASDAQAAVNGLVTMPTYAAAGAAASAAAGAGGVVTRQSAGRSGVINIGSINMPQASPAQLDTELGWRQRWGS